MLVDKVYEEAMKEGGFSSNARIVLIILCHIAIAVQMILKRNSILSFLLGVIAFILKWSDYKIFILFREFKFSQLFERLLLTNELAAIFIQRDDLDPEVEVPILVEGTSPFLAHYRFERDSFCELREPNGLQQNIPITIGKVV